jgi:hypothetical protein
MSPLRGNSRPSRSGRKSVSVRNSLLLTVVLAITYKVLPFLYYYFEIGYVLLSDINFTFSASKTKSSLMLPLFPLQYRYLCVL